MNAALHVETPKEAARRLSAPAMRDGYAPTALFAYHTADGQPWCWRIRCDHPSKGKWMRPFHHDGAAYVTGEPRAPSNGKPLYRAPYPLIETDPVFVVEGEQCADALAKLGMTAVTSGSATSADGADWSALRGRSVRLWPDNDQPGHAYADACAARLRALGCVVERIDVAALHLPAGGDCVDWLAANPGASADDVRMLALAPIEPAPATPALAGAARVELLDATAIKPEAVRWLWPGWLARGKLHVLAGAPSTCKTMIAMHWAACLSAGLAFPDGSRPVPGRVLIWSGEDDPADTLVPRLIAAGADLSHVCFVGQVLQDGKRFAFDPAQDVPLLADALADAGDVALIIVDPLVAAVGGDSHKNAEVRRSLAPLVELAERHDAALLGITHYSKGTSGREPLERVAGSLAFGALARIVYGTAKRKPEGEGAAADDGFILARCKSNIGLNGGGFNYASEITPIPGSIDACRIVWGAPLEGAARELLADAEGPAAGDDDGGHDAASFLRDLLANGSQPAKSIFADATAAGYSRDAMHRAKRKIGAEAVKAGMLGGWVWRLPKREGSAEGGEHGGQTYPPPTLPSGGELPPSGDEPATFTGEI